jgi:bacteriorhodopsin
MAPTEHQVMKAVDDLVSIDTPEVTQEVAKMIGPHNLGQITDDFQKLTVHERNVLIHGLNKLNLPPSKAPLIAEAIDSLNSAEKRAIGHDINYYFNPSTIHPDSLGGSMYMGSHDLVGATYYIAQNVMIAFTLFFFLERANVPDQWKTSMTVAGMVTAIAAWNYEYMKNTWVGTQQSPTTYRYTDWLITVPLLMLEFYLVLKATTRCSEGVFWRILTASLVMLGGGWLGESGVIGLWPGFIVGMAGWLYILYEIFSGESAALSANSGNKAGIRCFNTLRMLVTVGWAIYPAGYFFLLMGRGKVATLGVNVLYNLADVINKGFFGLACYAAAKEDSKRF